MTAPPSTIPPVVTTEVAPATTPPATRAPATTTPPLVLPTVPPTVPVVAPLVSEAPAAGCDPSYPGVCIPPGPPDLDCPQITYRRFAVVGADPHRFDADHDGIGCESG
ncbi:MAG: micrococcal nuclease [Actinomycetota bacterium]|nr:micrococcal nuclease [Actinomycetota bacterium]